MTDPESYDIHFYWDPVCPFAWMTSRWIEKVAAQRDYAVDYRFISLRILNKDVDYDDALPARVRPAAHRGPAHAAGRRGGQGGARARGHGRPVLGARHRGVGRGPGGEPGRVGRDDRRRRPRDHRAARAAGLPVELVAALDDDSWDAEITAETDEALALTGRDVGTPIIQFRPPEGLAFFGPVISRMPSDEEAVELWDHVVGLAASPGSPR